MSIFFRSGSVEIFFFDFYFFGFWLSIFKLIFVLISLLVLLLLLFRFLTIFVFFTTILWSRGVLSLKRWKIFFNF